MNIDWRERPSIVLADLYDGDRHLIVGTHMRASRANTRIPHPLGGVRYADGVTGPNAGRDVYSIWMPESGDPL